MVIDGFSELVELLAVADNLDSKRWQAIAKQYRRRNQIAQAFLLDQASAGDDVGFFVMRGRDVGGEIDAVIIEHDLRAVGFVTDTRENPDIEPGARRDELRAANLTGKPRLIRRYENVPGVAGEAVRDPQNTRGKRGDRGRYVGEVPVHVHDIVALHHAREQKHLGRAHERLEDHFGIANVRNAIHEQKREAARHPGGPAHEQRQECPQVRDAHPWRVVCRLAVTLRVGVNRAGRTRADREHGHGNPGPFDLSHFAQDECLRQVRKERCDVGDSAHTRAASPDRIPRSETSRHNSSPNTISIVVRGFDPLVGREPGSSR